MSLILNLLDEDIEGLVRCYCGCKYWVNLHCIDCGQKVNAELLAQIDLDRCVA